VLAGAFAAGVAAAGPPPMPGPAPPPRTGDRAAANADCVRCHEPIAREWADSLHRVAGTDAPYRAAYAREPLAFCQRCHVPEAAPRAAPPAWAEDLGVGCVTCHVTRRGDVLAAPGDGDAPHALTRSAAFAGPDACARCHAFGFPDAALRDVPTPMQATVEEHAASWARDYACADCHMPWVDDADGGHRSHAFAASRDPALLARAVGVRARRSGPAEVELTLTPNAAGHAFPTGDLFRRLELRVRILGDDPPRAPLVRRLGRRFEQLPQPSGLMVREEVEDTRIAGDAVTVRFDLGAAPGPSEPLCEDLDQVWVAWELRYQRVAFPDDRRPGGGALDGEVIVAHGVLPGRGS
jgi:hypothetical protein